MTVSEAKDRVSPNEFIGWIAYDRIDPIGRNRFDILASLIISWLYTLKTGKSKKISEIIPKWYEGTKDKAKEWNTSMKVWANMVNKKWQR